jgi:hypothetical protein
MVSADGFVDPSQYKVGMCMFCYVVRKLYGTEVTMTSRQIFGLAILLLSLGLLSGCQKVSEPWDTTGYFEAERSRTPEQQKALQHRLASSLEVSQEQPWVHAEH